MTNQQREAWPAFAGAAEGNLYVGVDPGATGAIAVLCPGNNSVWIGDMPVFHRPGSGSKRDGKKASGSNKLDAGAVMEWASHLSGKPVGGLLVEEAVPFLQNLPPDRMRSAISTAFKTACMYAPWEMFCACWGISYQEVKPAAWKKAMGLKGEKENKDESLLAAQRLFPQAKSLYGRNHNRAEALLLAEYGRRAFEGHNG